MLRFTMECPLTAFIFSKVTNHINLLWTATLHSKVPKRHLFSLLLLITSIHYLCVLIYAAFVFCFFLPSFMDWSYLRTALIIHNSKMQTAIAISLLIHNHYSFSNIVLSQSTGVPGVFERGTIHLH